MQSGDHATIATVSREQAQHTLEEQAALVDAGLTSAGDWFERS